MPVSYEAVNDILERKGLRSPLYKCYVIDSSLQNKNSYYKDLIENKILDKLKIRRIKKDGFKTYLIRVNKYGEQFKVPRLNNDRMVAQSMSNFVI